MLQPHLATLLQNGRNEIIDFPALKRKLIYAAQ